MIDLNALMVARVTMKGAILPLVTRRPFMEPRIAPKMMQKSSMSQTLPVVFNTTTLRPATSATSEPTERSIMPAMMRMDIPRVMIPLMDACSMSVDRLRYEK